MVQATAPGQECVEGFGAAAYDQSRWLLWSGAIGDDTDNLEGG